MSVYEVAELQGHLSPEQQKLLVDMLRQFDQVFDGKLGKYPHEKFNLKIEEDAKPVFRKAFLIPYQR